MYMLLKQCKKVPATGGGSRDSFLYELHHNRRNEYQMQA